MKPLMVAFLLLTAGCSSPGTLDGIARGPLPAAPGTATGADPVGIEANWKERLAQPYVYLAHVGDYRSLGDAMRTLFSEAENLGLQASGAPFALYFDDPGRVPVAELRARACLPVREPPARKQARLEYDVLPRAMVVYARVQGAYPEAARAYPALFAYLRDLGWRQGGPVREVYLVHPLEATSRRELLTEVQIPWIATGS